jgi:hypothetical protein
VPRQGGPPFLVNRLTAEPDTLEQIEEAERIGISLKRFQGWEPRTFYTYEDGVLVSSIPESEWDDQERGWMIALVEYRKGLCQQCGGLLKETLDPKNEEGYEHLPPARCERCVGLEKSRREYEEDPYPFTLMHRVKLKHQHNGVSHGGT